MLARIAPPPPTSEFEYSDRPPGFSFLGAEMSFGFGEIQTFVSDIKASVDFYQNKLGLKITQSSNEWAIFDISGIEFVLMAGASRNSSLNYGKTCGTVLCLKSVSIEQDVAILQTKGVTVVRDVQTVPQGKFAVIADPDGNFIEIIQH